MIEALGYPPAVPVLDSSPLHGGTYGAHSKFDARHEAPVGDLKYILNLGMMHTLSPALSAGNQALRRGVVLTDFPRFLPSKTMILKDCCVTVRHATQV